MIDERLFKARKAAGLSLRAVADKIGMSHAVIKKYEDGLSVPASDTLLKLSQVLQVRTEYFFRPYCATLDFVDYRKHPSLSKKQLDIIEYTLLDQIERRLELEELFPVEPLREFVLPPQLPAMVADLEQIEAIAETVREHWMLGLSPIAELISVLESRGIRVFDIDVKDGEKFDGLAATVDGKPVIVVGSKWSGDRQRFTMAHELGHLLLAGRLIASINTELACDRFAAAFLLPRHKALEVLGNRRTRLELKELYLLKHEYGLAMLAILQRAKDLGIVKPAASEKQMREFRDQGWHLNEPGLPYPVEKPRLFEQLVFRALAEDYIGESKAAELMGISLTAFRNIRTLEAGNASADQ